MHTFRTLRKWQWRTWRNRWALGGADRRKLLFQPLGLLVLTGFVFWGAGGMFTSLANIAADAPPGVLPLLQIGILNGVAIGMLMFLFMTGMRSINDTLFEGADVPFLLAQPIPVRAIFVSKFVDSFLASLALLGPLSLSVWCAFGVANAAPWFFYPLAIGVGLLGILLFHSIIVLLLLLIMRYVPGPRLKQLFVVLAGLGAVVLVLGSQLMTSRAAEQAMQDPLLLFETVGKWSLGSMGWLPHVWLAKGILLPFPAFTYSVWESIVPLFFVAGLLAVTAVALAGRAYSTGLVTTGETSGRSRRRTRRTKRRGSRRTGMYWALLSKDLALLRREPLVWYHLAVGTIIVGFFFYNTGSAGGTGGMAGPLTVLMPSMMASVAATQLGGVGISREGKAWELLRVQALDAKRLYWAKFVCAIVPPVIFVIGAAVALEYVTPFAYYPLPMAIGIMACMVVAVLAFQLLLDIFTPDFNLKISFGGRRQNTGSIKMTIAAITVMVFMVLLMMVLFIPSILGEQQWGPLRTPQAWEWAGVGALFVICLVTVGVSYALGSRRLHRMLHAQR